MFVVLITLSATLNEPRKYNSGPHPIRHTTDAQPQKDEQQTSPLLTIIVVSLSSQRVRKCNRRRKRERV